MLRGAETSGILNAKIGIRAKARLIAECEIRNENDGVNKWNLTLLVAEWALGNLAPLSTPDKDRLNALTNNGDRTVANPKHRKQKAKPAA